jgi:hypothetical protein
MGQFVDLSGKEFENLVVVRKSHSVKGLGWHWICYCKCDPGKELKPIQGRALGKSRVSCGCLRKERARAARRTHGESRTRLYWNWQNIKKRCKNSDDPNYGGRGITVCERWRSSFESFKADAGEPPEGHEIDREDNDGGYWCGKAECPECGPLNRKPNCRWVPRKVNANNKRTNRRHTENGVTKTVAEWAEGLPISADVLRHRLGQGMTVAEAAAIPVLRRSYHHNYKGRPLTYRELEVIGAVPADTIAWRVQSGWTVEEAVDTPFDPTKKPHEIEYEGRKWSLAALAREHDIDDGTFRHRLFVLLWPVEQALSEKGKRR